MIELKLNLSKRRKPKEEQTANAPGRVPEFFEHWVATASATVTAAKEIAPSYEAIGSIAVEQKRFGQTSGITKETIDALLLRVIMDSVKSPADFLKSGSYSPVARCVLPQGEVQGKEVASDSDRLAAAMIANAALSRYMANDALVSVKSAKDVATAYNSIPLGRQMVPAARLEQLVQVERDAHRIIAEQALNFAALYVKGGKDAESQEVGKYVGETREHAAKAGLEGSLESVEGRIAQIMVNAHVNSANEALGWAGMVLYNPEDSKALTEKIRALVEIHKSLASSNVPAAALSLQVVDAANEKLTRPFDIGPEKLQAAERNLLTARSHLEKADLNVNNGTGEVERTYRHLEERLLRAQTGNTLASS